MFSTYSLTSHLTPIRQKSLVCVALLLLAVDDAESSCYVSPQQVPNEITRKCKDDVDGTWHELGETWRNTDCMRCECSAESMSCCTMYGIPSGYSDDCIAFFDRQSCRYRVHLRNDSSIECGVHHSVGK
ncbi:beta-microseminoprotein-like [Scyliorhinus canicula]|uniref:beta-microseminoprotein-like n=1 Tax=Scyliorhinus canicula TaxID=7830 RepID=UPI0018F36E4B|nr:beta-microseminoprotein-like [Scyliorhinus canicula]